MTINHITDRYVRIVGVLGAVTGLAVLGAASAQATGTVRVTLPTTAGVMRMVGNATSRRTALVLRAEVRFPAGRFSGIGAAIPTQGNCLLTPLRRALITVTGSLAGAWNDS